ncbi:DivIVA domain-containing protein [Erysipelothrix sp. HDW6B]|uniref:DivIVA domain-containing protein n=1 Tax=Erysipelothrix TaxID=1647 RepID=UPI001357F3EA|nr:MULTISPECIES: DivIVA domain-containing protein [Erysipelothrix]QIK86407.1 DivIVA domain-containing protein [Erysipelothrix sp. HDW6B]
MTQKLTQDMILNKEFHVDFKGYSALEVDQFLDDVLNDYAMFETLLKEQHERLMKYEESLAQQRKMLLEYEGKSRAQGDITPNQYSHVDVLKRISKLEAAVFENQDK